MVYKIKWGCPYCCVRGEILGPQQDDLLRKHLPKVFLLIKNESWSIEED